MNIYSIKNINIIASEHRPFAAPTATELYNQWEKARDASFAKREFVIFNHDPKVIYQEN
jgi:hypothetical protein